jgi:hypothetical protein
MGLVQGWFVDTRTKEKKADNWPSSTGYIKQERVLKKHIIPNLMNLIEEGRAVFYVVDW